MTPSPRLPRPNPAWKQTGHDRSTFAPTEARLSSFTAICYSSESVEPLTSNLRRAHPCPSDRNTPRALPRGLARAVRLNPVSPCSRALREVRSSPRSPSAPCRRWTVVRPAARGRGGTETGAEIDRPAKPYRLRWTFVPPRDVPRRSRSDELGTRPTSRLGASGATSSTTARSTGAAAAITILLRRAIGDLFTGLYRPV